MTVKVTRWKSNVDKYMVTIRFRWPDGSDHRDRKVIDARSETIAKKWGEARETELRSAGKPRVPEAPPKPVQTVAVFAPRFIKDYAVADGHGEGGVEAKESILRLHVVPHIGDLRLDQVDTAQVQRLKGIWRAGVEVNGEVVVRPTGKTKTLNNRLSVLGKMLKVAVQWNELSAMPCDIALIRGDDSEEMSFLEHEVFNALVAGSEKDGPESLLVVLLAGEAGLRRGEMLGLKWSDIVVSEKLHVQRQVYFRRADVDREPVVTPTKGKGKRWVPLTPRLASALARHRHLRGPWVLSDATGRHLTPKKLRMLVERAERRGGLEVTGGIHILRHTFCSHLAMEGAPAITIQKLAGHASLETTMRYLHLSPDAAHDAIALLSRGRAAKNQTKAAG